MPGRKRKSAPADEAAAATPEPPPSRRRSQRVSSSGQKSKYFEAESESEVEKYDGTPKKGRGRGRPLKKAKGAPEVEADDDDDVDYKEEAAVRQAAQDSDDEFDEDAPPKVTFIPLPKLRDTGGIEYADDRLHPNTLAFLGDLKANNKRSWLKCMPAAFPLLYPHHLVCIGD